VAAIRAVGVRGDPCGALPLHTFISFPIQISILFFGPCIFNDEERINQQNAQINF
jgi:hypothetical protein